MPRRLQNFISRAKMCRPLAGRNLVERTRLIALLDEGLQKRLTLMSAPAGFGKTTLGVQWLAGRQELSAWLSLDKDDNDLEIFTRSLVAAVRDVAPKFGLNIERMLSTPKSPPSDYLANAMVEELATVDFSIIVVLDDYQFISSHEVHETVVTMLQNLPESFHMVILTRMDPPWPLGLWRARSWLTEVRATDLRFSREETRAFFKQSSSSPLENEIIDMLQERTEGWPAGIQLAQLSLAESQHPEQTARNFSGSDRLIVDFLMDEVVSQLPADILQFLAVSALFERFCAHLCDYVLAHEPDKHDSQAMIDHIERNNLFLLPLDNQRLWYRYHHLFQNLLQHHHKTTLTHEHKKRFYRLAAQWFKTENLIEDSIRYFIIAEDIDAAAEVLESSFHSIIDKDLSLRTLLHLLSLFPEPAKWEQPALMIAHAYLNVFRWDHAGLKQLLANTFALLQTPGCTLPEENRKSLHGDIDLLHGYLLFWQGSNEQALNHLTKARQSVPKEHEYAYFLSVMYTAGCLAISGYLEDALLLLEESFSEDCSNGCRNASQLLVARSAIHLYSGNLEAVRLTANHMLLLSESMPMPEYWCAYAPYFLGYAAYEQGLLDDAAEYFARVEALRYRINTRLYHDALLGSALVFQARGEPDKAWEYADLARVFAVKAGDPFSLKFSDSFEIRLAMLTGKEVFTPMECEPDTDSNSFWIEVPTLTRAAYLLNKASPKKCNESLQTIMDGLGRAEKHHNRPQVIKFLALKALAHDKAECPEEAIQALEEALRLAEPHGFIRTFVDYGHRLAELLDALKQRNPANSYICRLLDAFSNRIEGKTPGNSLAEYRQPGIEKQSDTCLSIELSNRETSVLLLIEQRLSNKEIARQLFISPETVKKHTANLCRKLKAKGRRQAVETARKHGLIPAS